MAENDLLTRLLDAGMTFTALTQARAEELIRDLVRAGAVQADKAQGSVDELLDRSRRNSEKLIDAVRHEIDDQLGKLDLATRDDIERLVSRFADVAATLVGQVTPDKASPTSSSTASGAATTSTAGPGTTVAPAASAPAPATRTTTATSAARKAAAKKASSAKKAPAKKAPAKKAAAAKPTAGTATTTKAAARKAGPTGGEEVTGEEVTGEEVRGEEDLGRQEGRGQEVPGEDSRQEGSGLRPDRLTTGAITSPVRRRLDAELVRRGLAASRQAARQAIESGRVTVAGAPATKAARLVGSNEPVGRGRRPAPVRVHAAARSWRPPSTASASIPPDGGPSTPVPRRAGSPTACCSGAQPGWWRSTSATGSSTSASGPTTASRCASGPTSATWSAGDLGAPFDLVVADLSFISLRTVLPHLLALAGPAADLVAAREAPVRGGPRRGVARAGG